MSDPLKFNKVELILSHYHQKEYDLNSFESFKNNCFESYRILVNYKLGLNSIQKPLTLKAIFYLDSLPLSKISINLNDAKIRAIEVTNDLGIPKKLIYTNKDFQKLNEKISYKLIEYWNLAETYEELEFLLFNINEMVPIFEIELVQRITMLTYKFDEIANEKRYQKVIGYHINILKELSKKEFNPLVIQNLKTLQDYWTQIITEDKSLNNDDECFIATMSELLGCATLSKNQFRVDGQTQKPLPSGKILLAPILIDDFYKVIAKQSRFSDRCSKINSYYGIEINKNSFKFRELLEKVYYHEVGHLYFAHVTNSWKPNPDQTKESFANAFASLIFGEQKKSLMIWLMTRYQIDAYKEPYLIKLPNGINNNEDLSIKSNILSFEKICEKDFTQWPHGKSKS